jgi:RecA-superfamily ATPases implicated in signal transduction
MEEKNECDKASIEEYKYEKFSTDIYGLDELLFGGIQKKMGSTFRIVICGGSGMNKSLFGVQLLQGITKSLRNRRSDLKSPYIISECKNTFNLEDLYWDYVILKCINKIRRRIIACDDNCKNNNFTNRFFNIKEDCNFSIERDKIDHYIGEGIIVYNSRINALVMASPYKFNNSDACEEEDLIIAERKNPLDFVFCDKENNKNDNKDYSKDFLNKELFSIKIFGKDIDQPILENYGKLIPCILVENQDEISKINLCAYPEVLINIVDDEDKIKELREKPDLVFSLRYKEVGNNEYLINQINISKSTMQTTALAWHQYKKRDYGIEIYPSLHLLMQRRRFMPMGVLASNYSILDETYQQYIDLNYKQIENKVDSEKIIHFLNERLEEYKDHKQRK